MSTTTAPTRFIDGLSARFAYRRFGAPGAIPLVLAMRTRGTIDHWDPAFLDALARTREVIVFDNRGTGASSGAPPAAMQDLADAAIDFVTALELPRIDLLGWSLGGIVAQLVALTRPALVRRLVVAGSSPGGVPGQPAADPKVWQVVAAPRNGDDDFLYLFFPDDAAARAIGLASLRRLDARLTDPAHVEVSAEALRAQLGAIRSFEGLWSRLDELRVPVLIANGARDRMIDAYASFAMTRKVADAKLVLYGDAGHAFLFQHAEDFAREIDEFLARAT